MPTPTKTLIGRKALDAAHRGVNAIYEPVRRTLGPYPKKALIYRTHGRGSRIVDDGYMVAEAQEPLDPFVRLAASTFKEACKRTNEKVGDATATTATIGGRLFNEAYRLLTAHTGAEFSAATSDATSASELRKRILASAEVVKSEIRSIATGIMTLEDLERIAVVSVGNDALGKVIAAMAWEVGVDGFIDVVEGYKGEIETEINKGFRFPAKIAAKAFQNNPARYEMVATDSSVLITNYALDNAQEMANLCKEMSKSTSKLVVIAPSFSDDLLISLLSAAKTGYTIFPVHAPSLRTEQFEDLASFMDAAFVDKGKGMRLQSVKFSDLGFVEKLIVKSAESREDAIATGGGGTSEVMMTEPAPEGPLAVRKSTKIAERVAMLKSQLAETKDEAFRKLMERRIASMGSAVGVIRVGDSTQASSLDLKMKIEDAVYACKSALRSGYVPGGGLCLKHIAENFLPEGDIVRTAILAPYEEIQSSVSGGVPTGPDIIDSADAEYYAVEHATAVVANLITVETITIEIEENLPEEGSFAVARMIGELSVTLKRHLGLISDSEMEQERDRLGGLTVDERVALDNG